MISRLCPPIPPLVMLENNPCAAEHGRCIAPDNKEKHNMPSTPNIAYSLDVFAHSAAGVGGVGGDGGKSGVLGSRPSSASAVRSGAAILAVRFLDYPPVVLESSAVGNGAVRGLVPFGAGKSSVFAAPAQWLRSRLRETPLYVLLFERVGDDGGRGSGNGEQATARLVGSASLSLSALFPASTMEHADDVRRGFRTGRYALYDAMGRHSATVVLAMRLSCLVSVF